jgi:hypothetical protein
MQYLLGLVHSQIYVIKVISGSLNNFINSLL